MTKNLIKENIQGTNNTNNSILDIVYLQDPIKAPLKNNQQTTYQLR